MYSTTPRTPRVIADELKAHADSSARAFVPKNVNVAIDLMIEFTVAVADAIDAANAAQAPAPAPAPAPSEPSPGG